jgi:hypothetical protein
MSLVLQSSGGGSITIQEPATASNFTQTLPAATGEVVVTGANSALVSGTAQTASGTSVDFTGIPSWVKRITVMLNGVSTNGTSAIRFQLMVGGSPVTTNYIAANVVLTSAVAAVPSTVTNGFNLSIANALSVQQGQIVLCNLSSSIWTASGTFYDNLATERIAITTGRVTSVGTVDGLRVTTTGGTDTFDAGSINILYE